MLKLVAFLDFLFSLNFLPGVMGGVIVGLWCWGGNTWLGSKCPGGIWWKAGWLECPGCPWGGTIAGSKPGWPWPIAPFGGMWPIPGWPWETGVIPGYPPGTGWPGCCAVPPIWGGGTCCRFRRSSSARRDSECWKVRSTCSRTLFLSISARTSVSVTQRCPRSAPTGSWRAGWWKI